MKRKEFTRTTKLAAWDRAGGCCEACGRKICPGDGPEYDHRIACELGGDNSAANCTVLCRWCHTAKTTGEDVPAIVKGRRVRARHANARTPKRKMPYRKFNGEIVWPKG